MQPDVESRGILLARELAARVRELEQRVGMLTELDEWLAKVRTQPLRAGTSAGVSLEDLDGDTKVQVEESSDEDKIRMDTGGTERAVLDSTALALTVPLKADTIAEKTGAAGVTIDGTLLKDGDVYPDANDLNLWFGKIGSNFFLQADTGDFIHYNVGLNKWYFYIGAAQRFTVDASVISAKSKPIQDVTDPTNAQDAATKNYVDLHAIASHNDTTATGTELETLTDGSDADALHDHATLATAAEAVAAVEAANPLDMTNAIQVDTINEHTGAAGVTIDGTLLKDGGITAGSNIVSDTDSTDDLGSSSKYWANVYADKLYLNATATLDGATAGRVTLTGNLDVSGRGAFGAAASPSAQDLLAVKDTITENALGYGINVDVKGSRATGAQITYGVTGKATSQGTPTAIGLAGLYFTALHESSGPVSIFAGCAAVIGSLAAGTGAIGTAQAFFAPAASWATPKPTVTCGLDIEEQGAAGVGTAIGVRVAQQTGTLAYLMELTGAATFPYLRVLAGAAPGANQTMLYLAEGGYNLRRVQWIDPGAGGANFAGGERVMVLV